MALKLANTVVINDSRQIQNCDNTDSITRLSIADSLRQGDNKIEILDEFAAVTHTIYGTD